jgi:hypothetical protein
MFEDRSVVTQPGEPLMRHALFKAFEVEQIDLGWIHGAVLPDWNFQYLNKGARQMLRADCLARSTINDLLEIVEANSR